MSGASGNLKMHEERIIRDQRICAASAEEDLPIPAVPHIR